MEITQFRDINDNCCKMLCQVQTLLSFLKTYRITDIVKMRLKYIRSSKTQRITDSEEFSVNKS